MSNFEKTNDFKKDLEELMSKSENLDIKDFTYSLLSLIWAELCLNYGEEITKEDLSAFAEEVRQSLEIMNPALKTDIELIENLLNTLENYKKEF
jgi:hypothetical protein